MNSLVQWLLLYFPFALTEHPYQDILGFNQMRERTEQDSRRNSINCEPPGQLTSIMSTTERSSHLCVSVSLPDID